MREAWPKPQEQSKRANDYNEAMDEYNTLANTYNTLFGDDGLVKKALIGYGIRT